MKSRSVTNARWLLTESATHLMLLSLVKSVTTDPRSASETCGDIKNENKSLYATLPASNEMIPVGALGTGTMAEPPAHGSAHAWRPPDVSRIQREVAPTARVVTSSSEHDARTGTYP